MARLLKSFLDRLATFAVNKGQQLRQRHVMRHAAQFPGIHPSVSLGPYVFINATSNSVIIGRDTYINDAILSASDRWPIRIGECCAIGYRVSIKAITHDPNNPAPSENGTVAHTGAPIAIGDRCWIGDNVFVREGITLGDDVVVGANSVVTKSFPNGSVVAGAPARKIR